MSSATENNNAFFLQEKFNSEITEKKLFKHANNFSSLLKNNNNNNNNSSNNNNNNQVDIDKNINDVWTKDNFIKKKTPNGTKESSNGKVNIIKTWASQQPDTKDDEEEAADDLETVPSNKGSVKEESQESPRSPPSPDKESTSPSHHARRPMNAFLIFCKKHRPIVRVKFPNLENRGITRILGEWWAMLDVTDKSAYTNLAKEYKDAFFSANPDFKWYKLPAPPLRTLTTRPTTTLPTKTSPVSSPTQLNPSRAEFTPGKLADESQLGSLTSLLSPNNTTRPDTFNFDLKKSKATSDKQDNSKGEKDLEMSNKPEYTIKMSNSVPPKKRISEKFSNFINNNNNNSNKNADRDIFNTNSELKESNDNNVTKQDLVDKVVDSIFSSKEEESMFDDTREPRKSIRSCKGRRYAEFMIEGKLFGNKHSKKHSTSQHLKSNFVNKNSLKSNLMTFDLEDTIKRLAERTKKKVLYKNISKQDKMEEDRPQSSQSENSEDGTSSSQNYFDLDLRISELPSLSYDAFLQRKRAQKKRKMVRHKADETDTQLKDNFPTQKSEENCLVGSKKRKNKNSITRLENSTEHTIISQFSNDLIGLATLAEIAANTEKIN